MKSIRDMIGALMDRLELRPRPMIHARPNPTPALSPATRSLLTMIALAGTTGSAVGPSSRRRRRRGLD